MMYCIWHKITNKVAVNLGGQSLTGLTREQADLLLSMIHTDIRHMVEIRPVSNVPDARSN